MKINTKLISQNFKKGRGGQPIKYLVLHDTWNFANSATAENHYKYFNGAYRGASAHYFIDETQILQIVKDEDTAWAVGDGNGKYGVTNQNSLSAEICVNDGDYKTEIRKAVELFAYLMKKHNIPITNVVRHYDASKKPCPNIMKDNNWKMWYEFVGALNLEMAKAEVVKLNLRGKPITLDGYLEDGTNYVIINGKKEVLRTYLEGLGLVVTWDQRNQTVVAI